MTITGQSAELPAASALVALAVGHNTSHLFSSFAQTEFCDPYHASMRRPSTQKSCCFYFLEGMRFRPKSRKAMIATRSCLPAHGISGAKWIYQQLSPRWRYRSPGKSLSRLRKNALQGFILRRTNEVRCQDSGGVHRTPKPEFADRRFRPGRKGSQR